jgi:pilus assembly protein CpaE
MKDGRVIAVGTPPTFRGQVARALALGSEQVEWLPSVTAVEELLTNRQERADVLVLSPGVKELDAFGLAQFLGRMSPTTAVVLVRDRTPNGILPPAMRAGIRDVVDLSKGSEELSEALERAMTWSLNLRGAAGDVVAAQPSGPRGTLVAVFSSKGGTGKTFLTVNLAVALAVRTAHATAVVDADLDMGDVFSYFGRESNRQIQDLLAVGDLTEQDEIIGAGTELMPNLVGYAAPLEPGAEPVPGEAMAKVLRSIRSAFTFTVVDASADYSDQALATFDVSDAIFLVAGLDIVGVRHLSSAYRTLLSLGVPRDRFRFVLNRADSKVGLEPSEVERAMKLKIDALIPSSRAVPISLNRGRPVYVDDPKGPVAKAIDEIAKKVVALTHAGAQIPVPQANAPQPQQQKRGRFKR